MQTDKDFYIYKYGNFSNRDNLNAMGKVIYSLFKILRERNNYYFPQIETIKITSQDRPGDSGAHGKTGKACDIVITPKYLMPYFAGLVHNLYPFNIYLGLYYETGDSLIENQHIHFDGDYSKRKNTIYYEGTDRKKLYLITKNNIDKIYKVYKVDFMPNAAGIGKYKRETSKLLLTDNSNADKLAVESFTRKSPVDYFNDFSIKIENFLQVGKGLSFITLSVISGYIIYKITREK